MDICFLPAWYYDLDGNGGGLFFREQAAALRPVVERVSLFYPLLGPRYAGGARWSECVEDGVEVFKHQGFAFPKRIGPLLGVYQHQVARAFRRYLKQRGGEVPDLIHAHSLWGAYAARTIRELWGIPFVYTEHLGRWTRPEVRPPVHELRHLREIAAAADTVTAVSGGLAGRMDDFLGQPVTLTTPNLVDTDFFRPKAAAATAAPFRLISIGDPWYTKGLDVLIEAVGIAQRQTDLPLQLTLVDGIPGRAKLFPLIHRYGLTDRVIFTGRLDRAALCDLLPEQDLLVSASRMESFGITMIEGLACGLPVLATRTAGALDIVRPGCGRLVEVNHAESLARGILAIIAERDRYAPRALAAYARDAFGVAAFQDRWLNIYRSVKPSADVA